MNTDWVLYGNQFDNKLYLKNEKKKIIAKKKEKEISRSCSLMTQY